MRLTGAAVLKVSDSAREKSVADDASNPPRKVEDILRARQRTVVTGCLECGWPNVEERHRPSVPAALSRPREREVGDTARCRRRHSRTP